MDGSNEGLTERLDSLQEKLTGLSDRLKFLEGKLAAITDKIMDWQKTMEETTKTDSSV